MPRTKFGANRLGAFKAVFVYINARTALQDLRYEVISVIDDLIMTLKTEMLTDGQCRPIL